MQKSTVRVRIKVKGSKHTTTGYSSYSTQSYDKKFKNAVLYAFYIDASKRHKKFKYDTPIDYELKSSSIAYVGKKDGKAKRGVNRRLHNELQIEQSKKAIKNKKEMQKEKEMSKSISKKKQQEELYGKKRMEREERVREEKMPRIKRSEYKLFLEFRAMRQKEKQQKINSKNRINQNKLLTERKVKKHNVRNYLGMNREAGKELHLSKKSIPKSDEVFINKNLKGRAKRQTIAHENYEADYMKKHHVKYKTAHKKALKIERNIK